MTYLYQLELLLVDSCDVGNDLELLDCQEGVLVHTDRRIHNARAAKSDYLALAPSNYVPILNGLLHRCDSFLGHQEVRQHNASADLLCLLVFVDVVAVVVCTLLLVGLTVLVLVARAVVLLNRRDSLQAWY